MSNKSNDLLNEIILVHNEQRKKYGHLFYFTAHNNVDSSQLNKYDAQIKYIDDAHQYYTTGQYNLAQSIIFDNYDKTTDKDFLYGCIKGYYGVVTLLIDANANINCLDGIALKYAIQSHNTDIIKLLIDLDVNISSENFANVARLNNIDLLKHILKKYTPDTVIDWFDPRIPKYDILKLLIEYNILTNDGMLDIISNINWPASEYYKILELFVANNLQINQDSLAYLMSVGMDQINWIQWYINNGADVNYALTQSNKYIDDTNIIKYLLNNNADVNICMQHAANYSVANICIENGADTCANDFINI